jgi:metal-sulfur cluster biosynthetic enzyme
MASREEVIEALKKVVDPELLIDIWTLGLVYEIDLQQELLKIKMTFTSPACPMGPQLVGDVKDKTLEVEGIDEVEVEVVFNPPWEPSDELKAMMGLA